MKLTFLILFLFLVTALQAQPMRHPKPTQLIDRVIAVVGNEPILVSDIEVSLQQLHETDSAKRITLRCLLLDQAIQKKLLLTRAKIDSLKVTNEQVEGELNRRIEYFVSQIGSEAALEKYYEKSIVELKNDFRDAVREQLLTEQQQQKVLGSADVSPNEVKKFFDQIPTDSLPYYNAEAEVSQVVLYPEASKEEVQREILSLRKIRKDLLSGKSTFFTAAFINSQDEGTRQNGGCMDWTRADNFVPEFSAAAMQLHKDSISDVVKTKYGYHIIKLEDRKGDMLKVCHILRIPSITTQIKNKSIALLDSLRKSIGKDSVHKFERAAYRYSQDEETRNRGGVMMDPKTNASRIELSQFDANTFHEIDKLKVGEISEPSGYKSADGRLGYRIIMLRSMTKPHKANLKDDYPKIKEMALQAKKMEVLSKWFQKEAVKTYIKIDSEYAGCDALKKWQTAISSKQ
jgi:peptidyl-prolyl cis-trans isomerase SurA